MEHDASHEGANGMNGALKGGEPLKTTQSVLTGSAGDFQDLATARPLRGEAP